MCVAVRHVPDISYLVPIIQKVVYIKVILQKNTIPILAWTVLICVKTLIWMSPLQHYAGQPWKAQYWLRQVMDRMYSPTPDGYCGDEDNGQTSAWYVFSALGFYPVCPGTDEYIIGAPLFKKATLHFENGNSLVIDAPNNSKKKFYVNSMNVNGADYTKNYLRHENLLKGGTINVEMSNQPNQNRGTKEEDMPYSFSKQQ